MKKLITIGLLITTMYSAEHIIDQKNKHYVPNNITVAVGDTLVFKNSDSFAHNAYTDDEKNEFDFGMQAPGKDKRVEIKEKSDFVIECAIHPNMSLQVHVK